jgi:hypothetical protein
MHRSIFKFDIYIISKFITSLLQVLMHNKFVETYFCKIIGKTNNICHRRLILSITQSHHVFHEILIKSLNNFDQNFNYLKFNLF